MRDENNFNLKYKCKTTLQIWQGRKYDTNKYKVINPETNAVEDIGLSELRRRFRTVKGNLGQQFKKSYPKNGFNPQIDGRLK